MVGRLHRWRVMRASVLAVAIGGITAGCHDGRGHGFAHRQGGHGSPEACADEARAQLGEMTAWVDERLELDATQRTLLGDLERTAAEVSGDLAGLCAHPERDDIEGMLAYGEEALEESLDAYRRVRPALEAFVAALDEDQRAEVERWMARRRGWRHG